MAEFKNTASDTTVTGTEKADEIYNGWLEEIFDEDGNVIGYATISGADVSITGGAGNDVIIAILLISSAMSLVSAYDCLSWGSHCGCLIHI